MPAATAGKLEPGEPPRGPQSILLRDVVTGHLRLRACTRNICRGGTGACRWARQLGRVCCGSSTDTSISAPTDKDAAAAQRGHAYDRRGPHRLFRPGCGDAHPCRSFIRQPAGAHSGLAGRAGIASRRRASCHMALFYRGMPTRRDILPRHGWSAGGLCAGPGRRLCPTHGSGLPAGFGGPGPASGQSRFTAWRDGRWRFNARLGALRPWFAGKC
jgi:hypothetical protein